MNFKRKHGQHLVLSAGQIMTLKTTGTVGGKDQYLAEIEEAMKDERDGKFSKW